MEFPAGVPEIALTGTYSLKSGENSEILHILRLARSEFACTRAVTGIPENEVYIRRFFLPVLERNLFWKAVKNKLAESIPDHGNSLVLSVAPVSRTFGDINAGQGNILVSSARRQFLTELAELFRDAGLEVPAFETKSRALSNLCLLPGLTEKTLSPEYRVAAGLALTDKDHALFLPASFGVMVARKARPVYALGITTAFLLILTAFLPASSDQGIKALRSISGNAKSMEIPDGADRPDQHKETGYSWEDALLHLSGCLPPGVRIENATRLDTGIHISGTAPEFDKVARLVSDLVKVPCFSQVRLAEARVNHNGKVEFQIRSLSGE
ncbi:MAG: PilN domain-containing protein [Candidatus Wallbacteria bacterium]|nr:PilN domain-containing protein [Candidatus Wallbacteria bacterium]